MCLGLREKRFKWSIMIKTSHLCHVKLADFAINVFTENYIIARCHLMLTLIIYIYILHSTINIEQ